LGHFQLEIVELVGQSLVGVTMNRLTNQEGQLVSILAWGRDSDGAGPIEVQVSQLVAEPLDVVRLEHRCVPDNVEHGRGHRALADALTDQEEVISLGASHDVVGDCARWRVGQIGPLLGEHPGVNPLSDDNESKFRVIVSPAHAERRSE